MATKKTSSKKKSTTKSVKAKVPTKSAVTAQKTTKQTAPRKTAPKRSATAPFKKPTPEARYKMIQDAAYYLAEKQHFQADPVAIWVEAEAEVMRQLGG